jgi:hypothetical protein
VYNSTGSFVSGLHNITLNGSNGITSGSGNLNIGISNTVLGVDNIIKHRDINIPSTPNKSIIEYLTSTSGAKYPIGNAILGQCNEIQFNNTNECRNNLLSGYGLKINSDNCNSKAVLGKYNKDGNNLIF